jgi:ornithine cyclodeaminase/alanine dehydrogenase-like protein (mu-crystallin family)
MCAYFIEAAKALTDEQSIRIYDQDRNSRDLLNQAAQWLNEMEQISRSEKLTYINKGYFR